MTYNKIRRTVTALIAALFLVPFVLITDLYPAVRFGMFAEPVRNPNQTEQFVLISQNQKGDKKQVKAKDLSLRGDNLSYLLRSYYYQDNMPILLEPAFKIFPDTKIWLLYRLETKGQTADTTDIKQYFTRNK